jgi:hypothetical protein
MKSFFSARHFLVISIALIAAITIQLVSPAVVHADDGTTPPVSEEPTTPTEGETPPAAEEPQAVEPVLENLPENVEVVVLSAEGTPEPLASQAAADAVANSDPFWCPDGTDPVGGGCTAYATFTDLLTGLQGVGSLTNGTVYVQTGVYGGSETQITFNGSTLTNIGNLTLIGGWDLAAATPSQTGVTTFDVPVSIINWTHNVSVQDIVVDGAIGTGLTVKTTAEVSVDDVIAVNNTQDGIHIEAGGTVAVSDVQADYNGDDGVEIISNTNNGAITLNTITTNHNGDDGIRIYSKQKSNITLKSINSTFNGGDGLDLQSPVETANCYYVEMPFIPAGTTGMAFPYDNIPGPTLVVYRICSEPIRQNLFINNSIFSNNDGNGMYISTTGDFTIGIVDVIPPSGNILSPVYANSNGLDGAHIDIFASTPPPFPWTYYMNRARALAGGPASVFALDDSTLRETFPLVDNTTSLLTNNNQGQNYFYETDGPGTWCTITENLIECASPPSATQITGGESLDLGTPSISGSDNEPGNESGNEPLCAKNSIVILQLPTNDNVTVFCPISGQISVKNIGKKALPSTAPAGATYVSGLEVKLSNNGAATQVISEGGHLKVSFSIPADLAGQNFAILYWDEAAGQWVELPAFTDNGGKAAVTDLGNGKQVLEGTKILSDVSLVEASVNFPGIFILVTK